MRRNLRKQVLKKLVFLRRKNTSTFFRCVVLNSQLNSISNDHVRMHLRLKVLLYSNLRRNLCKKHFFFTQVVTQCNTTWRSKSIYSFFKMSRITLREYASFGLIKGLRKASW